MMGNVLSDKGGRALMDAYWWAANYLSVGQIYLYDDPLLKQPLTQDHIKPRLLGYWGPTPGLNFIYVHLNRVIKKRDLDVIYITGPGPGGPGLVATAYLEGNYSEVYPNISPDEAGMKRLFQFSFPGGIPSHVAPETPGSIHEGHMRGYKEEGATTTPLDVCVLNDLDRFHLVSEVIDRVPKLRPRAAYAKQAIRDKLMEHRQYICWYGDDMPEIADWRWGQEVASTGCVPQRRTMSDPSRLRK
jgi:phosphoketolase